MYIKKEYKCYKGAESEECCNARVREALRNRNYTFVLILGIALMIISLVIKTSNNTVFVNQVSFASTITSIILSVIAIWMSITVERSTNEIKTKVTDSVNSIQTISSKTEELVNGLSDMFSKQNESGNLVTDLRDMLSEQNVSYSKIKNQMEFVLSEISGVKSTVTSLSNSFMSSRQNVENIPDNICLFLKNIVSGIPKKEYKRYLSKSIIMVFDKMKNNPDITMTNAYDMVCHKIDMPQRDIHVMYGIIVALNCNGFFENDKNYEYAKKLMQEFNNWQLLE